MECKREINNALRGLFEGIVIKERYNGVVTVNDCIAFGISGVVGGVVKEELKEDLQRYPFFSKIVIPLIKAGINSSNLTSTEKANWSAFLFDF